MSENLKLFLRLSFGIVLFGCNLWLYWGLRTMNNPVGFSPAYLLEGTALGALFSLPFYFLGLAACAGVIWANPAKPLSLALSR